MTSPLIFLRHIRWKKKDSRNTQPRLALRGVSRLCDQGQCRSTNKSLLSKEFFLGTCTNKHLQKDDWHLVKDINALQLDDRHENDDVYYDS